MPTRTASLLERRLTALVVDDSSENVSLLSQVLADEGLSVVSARDGESGVQLALAERPDLVVLDLILPGLMGIEVLDILKREVPEALVILTTAHGSEETVVQALRRGVNDYLINKQPFDSSEVHQVIERAKHELTLRRENARLQNDLRSSNEELTKIASDLQQTVDELRGANEKLRTVGRSKISFFSMISHELRHPLTVAKGYVELAAGANSGLDPETRGFLAIAEQNLRNLAQMVDDLLDFSRLEAGHYQIDPQPERPSTLVDHAIKALDASAKEKNITLINILPSGLRLVSADPLRIAQVLSNLLGNALKFTPPGGSITVSGCENDSDIEFIVSDTGIGIEPSELDNIFAEFYQVRNAKRGRSEGAGLGLAISRQIVRLHDGRMWASSVPGVGTELHFTLPKLPETESPPSELEK